MFRTVTQESNGSLRQRLLALTILAGALGGCSAIPDYANPVSWYDGVFGSDAKKTAAAPKASPTPSTDAANNSQFPAISGVPARPVNSSTAEDRKSIQSGLVADRNNAKYTDEELRGRPSGSNAPPPVPQAPTPLAQSGQPQNGGVPASAPRPAVAAQTLGAPPRPPAPVAQGAASAPATPPVPAAAPAPQRFAAAAPALPPALPARSGDTVDQVFAAQMAASASNTLPAGIPPTGVPAASTAAPVRPGTTTQPGRPTELLGGGPYASPTLAQVPGAAPVSGPASFAGITAPSGGPLAVVNFENGSARLDSQDRAALRQVASIYRQKGGKVRVVGYASSRTRDMPVDEHNAANYNISAARAQAVAQELVRQGVRAEAMVVQARSDESLVYYEAMPRAETANRRAEIFLEN